MSGHTWQGSCCRECEADVSWCDNPPAPAAPDNAGLRDALTEALRHGRYAHYDDHEGVDYAATADALLSGPLAALLAERDDLAAKVAAVLALATEYAERAESISEGFWKRHLSQVDRKIRAALGAPLTPATDEENR